MEDPVQQWLQSVMEKIRIEETKEKKMKGMKDDGRPSAIVAAKCNGKDKN